VALGALAPLISPRDPNYQDLANRLAGPSADHWLGTDDYGRDNLSRLLHASWVSLRAAATATGISVLVGVPLGLIAGLSGRIIDALLSRLADTMLSLPGIIFAIAVVGALGPGLTNAMIALGLISSPVIFRISRAAAASISHETYILASRSIGSSTTRILWTHVLPNAISPLLIQVTFGVAAAILGEASLSFLGLGAQPPTSSWGTMIRDAFRTIDVTTVPFFPPAIMIMVTVIALSVLGDGLRDAFAGRASPS